MTVSTRFTRRHIASQTPGPEGPEGSLNPASGLSLESANQPNPDRTRADFGPGRAHKTMSETRSGAGKLADGAVCCELLSYTNSLINRENTANFLILGLDLTD